MVIAGMTHHTSKVHLITPDGIACGADVGKIALDCHGDDRPDWITCPECRALVSCSVVIMAPAV